MYSIRCIDECDTAPLQIYQDQLEKLLSTIELGTKAKMDRNFAEVVTAIDRQNSNSSDSSNTELNGTYKKHCLNYRHFDARESSSGRMSDNFISFNGAIDTTQRHVGPSATSLRLNGEALLEEGNLKFPGTHTQYKNDSSHAKGLSHDDNKVILHHEQNQIEGRRSEQTGTIFADASVDTMEVKDTFESTSSNYSNISNSGLHFDRSFLDLTVTQDTNRSTPPVDLNDSSSSNTSTSTLPPTSAFINNEISVSSLMKQLLESCAPASNDFYRSSLLYNMSGVAGDNVSSSDFLLTSELLLTQIVRLQQYKVSNTYSIISEYQQLPDAQKDLITSTLSQQINLALEEQHRRSMDVYQQLQHRVNELQENYKRIIYGFRLHQEQRRKRRSDKRRLRRTKRNRKRGRGSVDGTNHSEGHSKRKSSRQEHNCSGKNRIEERKERKKRKKSKRRHKKETDMLDDDNTIKTSSPRLESALNRFNAKFDKLTLSCMEEVGYNGEECDELLHTFQNVVMRESIYRKVEKARTELL